MPFAISQKNLSWKYGKKQLAREENSVVLWDQNQSGNGEINLGLKYFVFFYNFCIFRGSRWAIWSYSFKSIRSAFFRRSDLFIIDSSEANNPSNDDYCLNLHWLVAKNGTLYLSRSLRVRTWEYSLNVRPRERPTWTGSEATTSFKNSLRTALSRSLKVRPKTRELGSERFLCYYTWPATRRDC